MVSKKQVFLDEIEPEILIPNHREKTCIIDAKKSGWRQAQVFTNDDFPKSIVGINLRGLTEKLGHPVYCLEATNKKLILQGWYGYNYGPYLLDKICSELLSSLQGEYLVRSIKKSDFQTFCHEGEETNYWLSSLCREEYGLYRVRKGEVSACTLFDPDGLEEDYAYSVRPIVINTEVDILT